MALIKVLALFVKTFGYFLYSFFQKNSILELKQKWANDMLKSLGYSVEVIGSPPDFEKNCILVGNHISYLDILVLMSANRRISFVAKKEIKNWPIIGPAADRVGTLFVDRSKSSDRKKVREQMSQELKSKTLHMTVFPSGTTTLFENIPWKKGVFEIAYDHQIPLQIFSLNYEPLRESAYIDDDSLLGQMSLALKIKNKKAQLTWLQQIEVINPTEDCEKARQIVVQYNLNNKSV